jgi:hypothetical protein
MKFEALQGHMWITQEEIKSKISVFASKMDAYLEETKAH